MMATMQSKAQIEEYDQWTINYLRGVGVETALLERVTRLAEEVAHKSLTLAAVKAETHSVRANYVDGFVSARVNRREGDFTNTELENWTAMAQKRWAEIYPSLAALVREAAEGSQ